MNFHFKNITNFINTKILKKKFTYTTFFKNCQFQNTYLRITMRPSKTLNPSLIYRKNPYADNLRIISTANIILKTKLLTSTVLVKSSGWLWYSIPMLKVLVRIQKRINLWNQLWSTKTSIQSWTLEQHFPIDVNTPLNNNVWVKKRIYY